MDDMFRAFFFFCISDFSHLPNAFLTEVNHQQSELEMNQIAIEKKSRKERKQGRTHGYRSHVRVGRGSDKKGYSSDWAGAATQKPIRNAKKKQTATDRPTDRHSGL